MKELKQLDKHLLQCFVIWEPSESSVDKWKSMNFLLSTTHVESRKFHFDAPTLSIECAPEISKFRIKSENESKPIPLQVWLQKTREYVTPTVLAFLSGGLMWLASSSF